MNHDRSDYTGIEKGENGAGFGQGNNNRPQKSSCNLRWVFFVVDAVLILAIAAAVLSLLSLFTPFSLFGKDNKETRTVTWTVEIEGASDAMIEALTEGSTVTDYETGETLGTVVKKPVTPDGNEAVTGGGPQTVIVTLKIKADYTVGEGYTVAGERIAAGRAYRIFFAGFVSDAECVTVRQGG